MRRIKQKQKNIIECIELYKAGISFVKIAKKLGYARKTLRKYLVKNGIKIKKRGMYKKQISSKIISNLYLSGISMKEIAKRFEVSNSFICNRLKINGTKKRKRPRGNKHHFWKGGKIRSGDYWIIYVSKHQYVPEHRLIWEKENGSIPIGWVIHHLNGNKLDNRIENLFAMPKKEHHPRLIVKPYEKRIKQLEDEFKKRL